MSTPPVKSAPEAAEFSRTKVGWFFTHYTVLAAIAAVFLYALGYFFNGYLSGFGYSMDAMPQDGVAVVLRAFFLLVHLSIYTLNHSFGISTTTLIAVFAVFVAIVALYGVLKLSAYLLDGLLVRRKGLVLKRASAARARMRA